MMIASGFILVYSYLILFQPRTGMARRRHAAVPDEAAQHNRNGLGSAFEFNPQQHIVLSSPDNMEDRLRLLETNYMAEMRSVSSENSMLKTKLTQVEANMAKLEQRLSDAEANDEPVLFAMQITSDISTKATPIPLRYHAVLEAVPSNAVDPSKGIFYVPVSGYYMFSFESLADTSFGKAHISIKVNDVCIANDFASAVTPGVTGISFFTMSKTVVTFACKGDQVSVKLDDGKLHGYIGGWGGQYTTFSGHIITRKGAKNC